ncbi:hypothetical protein AAFF_G00047950 [Aldrovandia affinis]|uniref:Reverse transcriptase zinc-binding domain-containing protein n=1 Tax=Aldrovandia affinis TaxID=143900 RepID=A0AAD7WEN0_9TELE|nr:hypothetical protein AAFF_G00047950 [Aldrovandia affinis]
MASKEDGLPAYRVRLRNTPWLLVVFRFLFRTWRQPRVPGPARRKVIGSAKVLAADPGASAGSGLAQASAALSPEPFSPVAGGSAAEELGESLSASVEGVALLTSVDMTSPMWEDSPEFYLAGFFRHLVALSHVVPHSETPSPGYRVAIRFVRQCPSPVTREEATDHRALYARLASRQVVTPSGVPAGVVWSRVSGGGAPGAVRDLQWRHALGRLPVRETLHRHGCAASPLCPRRCGAPETVFHVFWDCPYARGFWTLVQGLLRRVGPGHVLSRDGVPAISDLGCAVGPSRIRKVSTVGGEDGDGW